MKNPKYIYHYTSVDNAIKILESKQLFLFDVFEQKDNEEYYYAGNLVAEELSEIIKLNTLNNIYGNNKSYLPFIYAGVVNFYCNNEMHKNYLDLMRCKSNSKFKYFLNSMEEVVDYYIVSFSTTPKSNYLWENYSDNNNGIVLKFDMDFIIMVVYNLGCKNIQYIDDDAKTRNIINQIIFDNRNSKNFYLKTLKELVSFIVYSKSRTFQSENEFRITLHNNPRIPGKNNNEVFHLNGRDYVKLFRNDEDFDNSLTGIFLGKNIIRDKRLEVVNSSCGTKCVNILDDVLLMHKPSSFIYLYGSY